MTQALSTYLPESCYGSFGGGIALFAGVGSPMTHVVGIGFEGSVSTDELVRMENFYRERGSACVIDLCPLADASVLEFVGRRAYPVTEFNNVLVRRIARGEVFEQSAGITPVGEAETGKWSRLVSEGFSEHMPVSDEMSELIGATCRAGQRWFAGGYEPIGGAAMGIENGIALFFADSILLSARQKGWQAALIRERLAAGQRQGCDLAVVSVLPGSPSHRNYERAGFELLYTRANVQRDFDREHKNCTH